jgi:hypothetical protein
MPLSASNADKPTVCESRWRTRTSPLPFAANRGQ